MLRSGSGHSAFDPTIGNEPHQGDDDVQGDADHRLANDDAMPAA
jgi:hypothetical protein